MGGLFLPKSLFSSLNLPQSPFNFYKIALPIARDRQENGLYDIQTADLSQLRPDLEPHAPVAEPSQGAGDGVHINPAELTNSTDPKTKRLVRRKSELPQDMHTQRTLQQYRTGLGKLGF